MKTLILSAVCLLNLLLPSVFAQSPAERKPILLDVVLVDLKNQTTEDIEKLIKDKPRFDKTIADGKIKIVASARMRCLSGEANNIRIGQQIPVQKANSTQIQYENVGLNLSVTPNLTADKMIEMKYSMDWSVSIPNYQDANSAFITRQLSGQTRLSPNELTPIVDLVQREPFWKPANPPGQEKANEATGNFLLLFLGRVRD